MESKERTRSVIARLMGLDELPPQQSTEKQRSALSENYLQKVASLGVRERRSSYTRPSFRIVFDEQQEIKDTIELLEAFKKYVHHNQPVVKIDANATFLKSNVALSRHNLVDIKPFSVDKQLRGSEEVHNSMELKNSKDLSSKYPYKLDILYTNNLHKLQGVLPYSLTSNRKSSKTTCDPGLRKINRFRKSGKTHKQVNVNDGACGTLTRNSVLDPMAGNPARSYEKSCSGDRIGDKFLNFGNRNVFAGIGERRILAEDMAPQWQKSKFSRQTSTDWKMRYESSISDVDAKKRISERWKTTRKFQEVGITGRGSTMDEEHVTADCEIRSRKFDYKIDKSHLSDESGSNNGDVNIDTLVMAPLGHTFLDDSFSLVQDSSFQQDMSNGFREEGSVSSQCSCTDLGSFVSVEEVYQRSPDSVLERSCSSRCFESVKADLNGLRMQLESLESDSSEGFPEETGIIIVSSDEDAGEGSFGCYEEKGSMRSFRVEESRDFSYLVDVLTEAGFCGSSLDEGFDAWHSPECPISPSVFEMLEKKYGEQVSWMSSERKLLFDRINIGLKEIFQPRVGVPAWTKPVTDRLRFCQSWRVIEDKLWKRLVKEEKEANEVSSKKVTRREDAGLIEEKMSKMLATREKEEKKASYEEVLSGDAWLEDIGDDVEEIGKEIERLLIDELVEEVVKIACSVFE